MNFYIDLAKSSKGEGSRGGHVIGHTKSGKPIYEDHNHSGHSGFSVSEHEDAINVHTQRYKDAQDKYKNEDAKYRRANSEQRSRMNLTSDTERRRSLLDPQHSSGFHEDKINEIKKRELDAKSLGKTKSGKSVHEFHPSLSVHEERYKDFSPDDHIDASVLHSKAYKMSSNNSEKNSHLEGAKSHLESAKRKGMSVQDFRNKFNAEMSKSEKLIGGLADGIPDSKFPEDKLEQGKKVESEHTKDKQQAKEIAKDHIKEDPEYYTKLEKIERSFLFIDLMKAKPHKYIRKYRGRGGEWVYIYYEGDHHHKMSSREQELLHEMADRHGNRHARALIDDADEIHSGHLKLLDELSDVHNNEKAKAHREHLKGVMGDDYNHVLNPHEADRPFTDEQKVKVNAAILAGMEVGFKRLRENASSVPTRKFEEHGITKEDLMAEIDTTSLRTTLESMHRAFKKADIAHDGLTLQYDQALNAGGYGNLMYQRSIKVMEEKGVLPEGYNEVHTRKNVVNRLAGDHNTISDIPEPSKVAEERERIRREKAEREARERAERAEREARERAAQEEADRREAAGLVDTIGYKAAQMMDGSWSQSQRIAKAKAFNKTVKKIFGKDIPKDFFPYDFPGSGITVKIEEMSIYDSEINFTLQAYNAAGMKLTRVNGWQRTWDIEGGRPHIYNNLLKVDEDAKGGAKIGHLVNESQRKLMLEHAGPNGGTVTVTAALSVGPYMWCNTGFSYKYESSRERHVNCLKNFLRETGQSLSEEQIALFTDPCHFAAFDDGKLYELQLKNPSKLTPKQIETGYLDGVANGKWKLTEREKADGESMRMAVNAGKYLLLKNPDSSSWNGIWDSKKDTIASRYAAEYTRDKKSALRLLGDRFLNLFQRSMIFYIDLFKARRRDLA